MTFTKDDIADAMEDASDAVAFADGLRTLFKSAHAGGMTFYAATIGVALVLDELYGENWDSFLRLCGQCRDSKAAVHEAAKGPMQ